MEAGEAGVQIDWYALKQMAERKHVQKTAGGAEQKIVQMNVKWMY